MRNRSEIFDEYLVLGCQKGQRKDLDLLAKRWHPKMVRHACRMTGNVDAAADVAQDSWMAIARGIRRLKDPTRFRSWAYRIVTNKCRDWIRRQQRDRARNSELPSQAVDPSTVRGPDHRIMRLRSALKGLSAERRSILSMYYLEGFSVSEIGRALDIAPGTVKSRLFRARNELRGELEELYEANEA
jgi:RNA polymerase sigma-70 factor (ECF subfamily)